MRILMIRLSALGDVVMGLHVLSTLRQRLCSAGDGTGTIGWAVEDRFAPLLEGHPEIDVLHVFRRGRSGLYPPSFLRSLRKERYDVALDLQGNLKSGILARFSGAKRRIGFGGVYSREGNGLFVKEKVTPPRGHRVEACFALVDAALGQGPSKFGLMPANPEPHGAIVIHPFVSAFFANKEWPPDRFARLGERLSKRLGKDVVITAGPGEGERAEAIRRDIGGAATVRQPDSLPGLRDVIAGASLMIGGDTGPTHMAAALGVPTLGLMGPTDMETLAPYGPRARAISAGVRCSPCASPFGISKLRWCPDPVCMAQLDVDAAEQAALELLA